jgi:hypothetical protein
VTLVPIIMFGPNDVVFANIDVDDACFEALVFGH